MESNGISGSKSSTMIHSHFLSSSSFVFGLLPSDPLLPGPLRGLILPLEFRPSDKIFLKNELKKNFY